MNQLQRISRGLSILSDYLGSEDNSAHVDIINHGKRLYTMMFAADEINECDHKRMQLLGWNMDSSGEYARYYFQQE